MDSKNKTRFLPLIASFVLALQAGAANANVAQTPLFVSAAVEPNVMLLIDNSGSMDTLIWAAGYDPDHAYPHWGNGATSGRDRASRYAANGSNIKYSALSQGSCSDGYVQGQNSQNIRKCLRLPRPVGSNTRFDGNYLNYLFETYSNNSDLTDGRIPTDHRMKVAREVATNLVRNTSGVRFGVASFNRGTSNNGGSINAACGSTTSTLTSVISGLSSDSNTPLAEAYYEITRYFRGLSRFQGSGSGTYTSPIQYRCQKNFTVVITDGLPTYDTTFPSDDPDDPDGKLPNWDGKTAPYGQPFSDGHGIGGEGTEGYSLYLDDLAKFGYDIDMRKSGTDLAGKSWNDPRFPKQNLQTYTVGFAIKNQMLEDAAFYGHGDYYTADNADQLSTALTSALTSILDQTTAAAAVATNSTRLDTDTLIYQARFNPKDWSGQLLAYQVNSDGSIGTIKWDAATKLPAHGSRKIYTWKPALTAEEASAGTEFKLLNSLNTAQQQALNLSDNLGQQRLDYLRGDRSLEQSDSGGVFRKRSSILGDIVNSDPAFVSTADFGYGTLPGDEGIAYRVFRNSSSYKSRPKMLYTGANDGMLHGFDATTGVERFAYVPNLAFNNLALLTDPDYAHRYFVDGGPRVGDAYINEVWRTVLLGTLGAGGKGVFALDISNPGSFGANQVLWEFPANPATVDADLGLGLGQAAIARLQTGQWVAIFGNGPASTNKKAVLYIVDLSNGTLLKKIDTKVGSVTAPNGLSTPVPIDLNGDRITDVVYAGDLQGNLWKFDLTGNNSNNWEVAFKSKGNPAPLFSAVDSNGRPQPITARPVVGAHPKGGVMIYFGTGKYFETGDKVVENTDARSSFYAIRDTDSVVTGRSALLQQSIIGQVTDYEFQNGTDTETYDIRFVSNHELTDAHKGWYLDLLWPNDYNSGYIGERVVAEAILRHGRIIFTTLIPELDPCAFGGTSWLMEIDAISGSRLHESVFDLNGDGLFDEKDLALLDRERLPASGKRSKEGIIKRPGIINAGEREYKFTSGTSGTIEVTTESAGGDAGRQSWRQLR